MAKIARTIIKADDKTRGAIESAKKGMRGYARTTKNQARLISATVRGLKTAFIAMGVAVLAAVASGIAIMTKAVRAANEQEAAETSLTVALGKKNQALLDDAAALQQVSTFGDEQIIQAQALIAMFVKEEAQIKLATRAALDLAAAKGMSLAAAADLVAKTLGSTTNALTRYGIAVTGAVGSTERLTSLTENIEKVFGGQAQAQALTFGGVIKQLQNDYGDLWEEIGFIITRNSFFIDGVKLVIGHVQSWTQKIKDNREALITMAQSGIIAVVKGLGKIVEVARFVSNAWNGIKLVGNAALTIISEGIELVIKGLRLLLKPLDVIWNGMVKIGLLEVNPFDTALNAVEDFSAATKDINNEIIADIERTNAQYDGMKQTISGLVTDLEDLSARSQEVNPADVAGRDAAQAAAVAARLAAREEEHAANMAMLAEFQEQEIANTVNFEGLITRIKVQEAAARLDSASSLGANLVTIGGKFGKAGLAIQKALAIRSTIIETWRGAQQAFSSLAGIPIIGPALGVAAAAAAIAAGFIRVKSIVSESKSGGGGGGVSISRPSAPPSAIQAPGQGQGTGPVTNVSLTVNTLATDQVGLGRVIADVLKEATGDGFDSGMELNITDAEA